MYAVRAGGEDAHRYGRGRGHVGRPVAGGQSGAAARLTGMAETTKWEYATVPLIVHATKQILDQWGEDGWELVQVLVNPDSGGLVAYLKRPVS
jgi:hypothetical protein